MIGNAERALSLHATKAFIFIIIAALFGLAPAVRDDMVLTAQNATDSMSKTRKAAVLMDSHGNQFASPHSKKSVLLAVREQIDAAARRRRKDTTQAETGFDPHQHGTNDEDVEYTLLDGYSFCKPFELGFVKKIKRKGGGELADCMSACTQDDKCVALTYYDPDGDRNTCWNFHECNKVGKSYAEGRTYAVVEPGTGTHDSHGNPIHEEAQDKKKTMTDVIEEDIGWKSSEKNTATVDQIENDSAMPDDVPEAENTTDESPGVYKEPTWWDYIRGSFFVHLIIAGCIGIAICGCLATSSAPADATEEVSGTGSEGISGDDEDQDDGDGEGASAGMAIPPGAGMGPPVTEGLPPPGSAPPGGAMGPPPHGNAPPFGRN